MLTPKQLEQRKQGIGGSDAAAAVGISPYKSPLELYFEKIGEVVMEQSPTKYSHFGQRLEEVVADEYEDRTGCKVRRRHHTFVHPDHDFMLAHVDRTVDNQRCVLECKTTDKFAAKPHLWGQGNRYSPSGQLVSIDNQVPEYYLVQCCHYMSVLNYERCDLAVLIGGNDFRIYTLERNYALEAQLIEMEKRFWYEHVLKRKPPRPVSKRDVQLLYAKANGEARKVSKNIESTVNALKETKQTIAELKCEQEGLELDIKRFLGNAEVLLNEKGQSILTWKQSAASTRFNEKSFAAEHPDLYQRYCEKRPGSRRLHIKKELDA